VYVTLPWLEKLNAAGAYPLIEAGRSHAWIAPIGQQEELPVLDHLLHPEDVARAGAIRNPRARRSFTESRLLLRTLLFRHTQIPPSEQRLAFGPHGKPRLEPCRGGLNFNLSHCDGWAMVAFSAAEIGVDVEVVRPRASLPALTARYFSEAEQAYVHDSTDLPAAFFRVWTCKEALLKARGVGITVPLAQCDVASAVSVGGGIIDGWHVFVPTLPGGVLGAVVSHDAQCDLEYLA